MTITEGRTVEAYLIYITMADKAQARQMGRFLVESRLAACVNIFDGINSMYLWRGEFQDDQEAVLIAKSTKERVPELIAAVKARHGYDCPCVVTLPISGGNAEFLSWIGEQVGNP